MIVISMISKIKNKELKEKYVLFKPKSQNSLLFTDHFGIVIIGHNPIDKTRWIIARVSVFPTVCKTGSPRDKLKLPGLN